MQLSKVHPKLSFGAFFVHIITRIECKNYLDTFYSIIPHERLNWDIGWKKNLTYKCRAFKSVAIKFAPCFLKL